MKLQSRSPTFIHQESPRKQKRRKEIIKDNSPDLKSLKTEKVPDRRNEKSLLLNTLKRPKIKISP